MGAHGRRARATRGRPSHLGARASAALCLGLLAASSAAAGSGAAGQGRRRLQQGPDGPPGLRGPPRPRPPWDIDAIADAPAPVPFVNTTMPPVGKLLWAEEFDGSSLDDTKWNIEEGDGSAYGIPGWGNDELEVYDKTAVAVRNGQLVITATQGPVRTDGNHTYYSGKVSTSRKVSFYPTSQTPKGIRVEASVYLPYGGPGVWPSVWLLPVPNQGARCYGCGRYGPWPTSGEINLMEAISDMRTTYGWTHFGGPPVNIPDVSMQGGASIGTSTNKAFHSYAIDWNWQNITFSVDNHSFSKGYCSRNLTDGGWYTSNPYNYVGGTACAPFDQPFYLVIQLAIGGGWPGYPTTATRFPQYLSVDYVRVYEL